MVTLVAHQEIILNYSMSYVLLMDNVGYVTIAEMINLGEKK